MNSGYNLYKKKKKTLTSKGNKHVRMHTPAHVHQVGSGPDINCCENMYTTIY